MRSHLRCLKCMRFNFSCIQQSTSFMCCAIASNFSADGYRTFGYPALVSCFARSDRSGKTHLERIKRNSSQTTSIQQFGKCVPTYCVWILFTPTTDGQSEKESIEHWLERRIEREWGGKKFVSCSLWKTKHRSVNTLRLWAQGSV